MVGISPIWMAYSINGEIFGSSAGPALVLGVSGAWWLPRCPPILSRPARHPIARCAPPAAPVELHRPVCGYSASSSVPLTGKCPLPHPSNRPHAHGHPLPGGPHLHFAWTYPNFTSAAASCISGGGETKTGNKIEGMWGEKVSACHMHCWAGGLKSWAGAVLCKQPQEGGCFGWLH